MLNQVLMIDDDPINNMICEKMVLMSGFAHSFQSFLEPLEALKFIAALPTAERPDLIFLDINMPVLNGWMFLDRLEERLPHHGIQIVILTSSIGLDDQARAETYPVVMDFETKPLTPAKLQHIAEKRKSL